MTKIKYLDELLNSVDSNGSIIEFDNFIGELCDYGADYSRLTDQQKLFYLNQNLEREVNNGGLNQYSATRVATMLTRQFYHSKLLEQTRQQIFYKKQLTNFLIKKSRRTEMNE